MPSRASATRYAKALFDVVLQESDLTQVERDLAGFVDLMTSNPELQSALTNPAVPASGKRGVTEALVKRLNVASPVGKLLLMLADRDRMAIVPDLLAVYRERLMEHQQVVRAQVTTAEPLSQERTAQIQQRLATATGRTVDITTTVDPAIIGGIVARIGSTVYDGSVATQLSKIREALRRV